MTPSPDPEPENYAGAPPFLSAGWKTIHCPNGIMYYYNNDDDPDNDIGMPVHLNTPTPMGTKYISEDRIDSGVNTILHTSSYDGYFFYSENIRETSTYSRVDIDDHSNIDDDRSEGTMKLYNNVVTRFSNDKVNWTEWLNCHKTTSRYKYAQFGIACSAESDSALDMWFRIKIDALIIST